MSPGPIPGGANPWSEPVPMTVEPLVTVAETLTSVTMSGVMLRTITGRSTPLYGPKATTETLFAGPAGSVGEKFPPMNCDARAPLGTGGFDCVGVWQPCPIVFGSESRRCAVVR